MYIIKATVSNILWIFQREAHDNLEQDVGSLQACSACWSSYYSLSYCIFKAMRPGYISFLFEVQELFGVCVWGGALQETPNLQMW